MPRHPFYFSQVCCVAHILCDSSDCSGSARRIDRQRSCGCLAKKRGRRTVSCDGEASRSTTPDGDSTGATRLRFGIDCAQIAVQTNSFVALSDHTRIPNSRARAPARTHGEPRARSVPMRGTYARMLGIYTVPGVLPCERGPAASRRSAESGRGDRAPCAHDPRGAPQVVFPALRPHRCAVGGTPQSCGAARSATTQQRVPRPVGQADASRHA